MDPILSQLPQVLPQWYGQCARDLPWRHTHDPYRIWVSEIMLQQTRVEAVKGYYARFLTKLPTVQALARCDGDALHKLWEGLGYYSRVRNLKKAAQVIVTEYGGVFPKAHDQILALPGIGPYTAGAIASIAFNAPTPAVDGNVLRLVSRLTDDPSPIDAPATKAKVTQALAEIYPREAGLFTQALMELGATLCGPNRAPECGQCPCKDFCLGFSRGSAQTLPVKAPKKEKRTEEKTVFLLSCQGFYALHRRENTGLLAGLWEFPNVSGALSAEEALRQMEQWQLEPRELKKIIHRKHIFTHIVWEMEGVYAEINRKDSRFVWMTVEQLEGEAALPTAFRQFWEEEDHV